MALSPSASYKSHYQHFTPPFEIPESWKWVSLPEVCRIPITDGTHKTPIYSDKENGVPFLSSKDVTTRQINWDNIKFIDRKLHEELYSRLAPKRYDILLAKNGTTGVAAMVDTDAVFDIYVTLALIRPMIPFVYPKYLLYVINSDLCKAQFNAHLTGIGLPNLHLSDINKTIIPLPPIEEQIKIANEIDIWFSSVNMLEQNKEKLYVNITLAKSKILDLAMQGKLVPQDPADEPAADMLLRINPKAKIITDNPHSRNIPNGWCLCELRDLCSFLSRGKSPKYSDVPNNYPVFAQKCNLKDGGISLNQARFLDESTLLKWPDRYKLKDLDILVNSTGTGTVGRTRLFLNKYLKDFPFVLPDSHVSVVRTFDEIDSKFIYYNLISREGQTYFNDNLSGSTNQKELYIEAIGNKLIFLPPKNEQERIVAKIEKFYHCIDNIEASLQS